MKVIDRLLGVNPNQLNYGGYHYERYRTALKWITVGGIAIAAGGAALALELNHVTRAEQ